MAREARASFKAVLEELGKQCFILGQGDNAIADVAGREHVELFAQAAAGAAIVGDGDHGAQVADETPRVKENKWRRTVPGRA